jgi:hypothetical protein
MIQEAADHLYLHQSSAPPLQPTLL